MDSDSYPTELGYAPDGRLKIVWSDGQTRLYRFRELRDGCPCATCREKRGAPPPPVTMLPLLSTAELQPLRVTAMRPVGNYAYSVEFSDGHDTGIYTFDLLRGLGETV